MIARDFTDLRRRLEAERDAILAKLSAGDHLAPGLLNLLTGVQTSLSALDAAQLDHAEPPPARARARVRDIDGEPLALVTYAQDGAAVSVEVPPLRALALAEDLTAAARRRLTTPPAVRSSR